MTKDRFRGENMLDVHASCMSTETSTFPNNLHKFIIKSIAENINNFTPFLKYLRLDIKHANIVNFHEDTLDLPNLQQLYLRHDNWKPVYLTNVFRRLGKLEKLIVAFVCDHLLCCPLYSLSLEEKNIFWEYVDSFHKSFHWNLFPKLENMHLVVEAQKQGLTLPESRHISRHPDMPKVIFRVTKVLPPN